MGGCPDVGGSEDDNRAGKRRRVHGLAELEPASQIANLSPHGVPMPPFGVCPCRHQAHDRGALLGGLKRLLHPPFDLSTVGFIQQMPFQRCFSPSSSRAKNFRHSALSDVAQTSRSKPNSAFSPSKRNCGVSQSWRWLIYWTLLVIGTRLAGICVVLKGSVGDAGPGVLRAESNWFRYAGHSCNGGRRRANNHAASR